MVNDIIKLCFRFLPKLYPEASVNLKVEFNANFHKNTGVGGNNIAI